MKIERNVTHKQIVDDIFKFVHDHDQHKLQYVIAYCVGYYGAVDENVWEAIRELLRKGVIV